MEEGNVKLQRECYLLFYSEYLIVSLILTIRVETVFNRILRLISSTDQRSKRLARFEGRKITSQS